MRYFDRFDGLTDEFLKGEFAQLGEVEQVEAMEEVLTSGSRRLVKLFAESELTEAQVAALELTLENVPEMTDAEVVEAYKGFGIVAKAKLSVVMKSAEGIVASRVKAILGFVKKEAKDVEAEARKAEVAAFLARIEDKTTVLNDEDAVRFVETCFAERHFRTAEQIEELVVHDEDGDKIWDMRNKVLIPIGDARVIRLVLVISQLDAARLCGKLTPIEGRPADQPYTVGTTVTFLRSKAEESQRRHSEAEVFQKMLDARFAEAKAFDQVASIRLEIIEAEPRLPNGSVPKDRWEAINAAANSRKSEIYHEFLTFLKTTYMEDEDSVVDLRDFLAKKTEQVERDFPESDTPEQVRKAALEQLNVIERHLEFREKGLRRERRFAGASATGHAVSMGTHRNGKPPRERDPREEDVRDARRFLVGLNYDGLPEARKTQFKGRYLTVTELEDEQILSEAKRLRGAAGQLKADKKNSGGGQKGSQRGGK